MAESPDKPLRLQDSTARWLDRQVDAGDFSSRADAVEHLVRQARVSQSREVLESRVRAGLRSGKPVPLSASRLRDIERRGLARLAALAKARTPRPKKSG